MRQGHPHPDFPIIPSRGEHARIPRVPGDGVDAAGLVALERFDEGAVFFVPDVDA